MKKLKSLLIIIQLLFFFVACDDFFSLRKDLDIELLSLPPKLSVIAILHESFGQPGQSVFDIRVMESFSLAEIKEQDNTKKDIIRNGEIRLYEDGELILSLPGPLDMSTNLTNFGPGWKFGQNGFRYYTGGINTRTGSEYRLEVEVEGFPMAVSTAVMPVAPVISASMDTAMQVVRQNVKEIGVAGYWLNQLYPLWYYDNFPEKYWPFSMKVDVPDENNYFALDLYKTDYGRGIQFWLIGGSDASIFMEIGMESELIGNNHADLYLFPMLALQSSQNMLNEQPVTVVSNINNKMYYVYVSIFFPAIFYFKEIALLLQKIYFKILNYVLR